MNRLWCTTMEFLQYCLLQVRKSHFCTEKTQRETTSSCGSRESQKCLQLNLSTVNTHSAICPKQHITRQRILTFASLIATRLITVCRWRTSGQWKCLHSLLLAELLPTKDLHKFSADPWLIPQFSCLNTWTRLSGLINVLNTWTVLGLQSRLLRILPGTFGQSSSALAKQHWNWQ